MNDIEIVNKQLPATLPELARFALVGREKLNAVRAEIRAIDKVGLAREVREQKLKEAQDIAEAVLDAEVRIGELMERVPKRQGFASAIHDSGVANVETKSEVIRESGFSPKQVERFQTIAKHPDIVEQAKAEAREQDEIVTRSAVLGKIQETKTPHVANNSGDNEWYTPSEYIEAAREVMGSIDLDPASNDFANETVKASHYYTEETNGLLQEWSGNIWMNPPYSSALIKDFAIKLADSNFSQAVILVNNATETTWFKIFISKASAVVFPTGRIHFYKCDGEKSSPLQGQAFIYCGHNADKFLELFSKFGWGAKL